MAGTAFTSEEAAYFDRKPGGDAGRLRTAGSVAAELRAAFEVRPEVVGRRVTAGGGVCVEGKACR